MIRRSSFTINRIQNPIIFSIIALSAALVAEPALGFVSETDAEFQTLADVDGDGYRDLIIVDKESGQFRIGEGNNNGEISWRNLPGDSGLAGVTGFSAGPVRNPKRDALLFAEPFANRIHLVEPRIDQRQTDFESISASALGPTLITAIDIPGEADYDPNLLDILYHTTLEGEAFPNIALALRSRSGPFGNFGVKVYQNKMARPNRIVLEENTDPAYGVIEQRETGEAFRLFDLSSTTSFIDEIDEVSALPTESRYLYADFNGNNFADFIFYRPGSEIIYESSWNGSSLSSLSSFSAGNTIVDIRLIESAGNPELFIIFDDGTYASRATYSGNGNLTTVENFFANEGQTFTGAFNIGNKLHLLQGTTNGISISHQTYEFDGISHELINEKSLTPLKSIEVGSSLLLFDAPPLTDPSARLVGRFDAGPWTSAFTLRRGRAQVTSEVFQNPASGLGAKETIALQNLPPATGAGLTNQIAPDLSLLFQERPTGIATAELALEPTSGTYSQAVRPVLTTNHENPRLFYRTSQDPDWIEDLPPIINSETTLYAFAIVPGLGFSNIVKADYSFTEKFATLDSNGDGIPDFASDIFGLDPLSPNHDSDGDGFSNLEELLAGTDPNDPDDFPLRADVAYQFPNSFNLVAAPAIPDPANPQKKLGSLIGEQATQMTLHQPNGFSLGTAKTDATSYIVAPAALFEAVDIADSDLFVIASTESNFKVGSRSPKDYGRQVLRLVPIPKQRFERFVYNNFRETGGTNFLAKEALAWLDAARDYYENLQRETVIAAPIDPESTLVALLVEKILGELLYERGLSDRANISLTSFRSAENPLAPNAEDDPPSSRSRSVAHNDLLALQRKRNDNLSSYKISELIQTVENAVAAPASKEIVMLVELTTRLYTVSAGNSQAGALRQPLDALRRFLQTGKLDNTGYETETDIFPEILLANARAGVTRIIGQISPRSTKTVSLIYEGLQQEVDNLIYSGITPIYRETNFSPNYDPENPMILGRYILIDDQQAIYPIARAFPLTAGSVFQVTGFVEGNVDNDLYLEVIGQPKLLFTKNANLTDLDGDLIPDPIQELFTDTALSPFIDTDGDGYSDLQEILDGSDPTDPNSIPMKDGLPAPVVDLSPPQVFVEKTGNEVFKLSFDFPADYRNHFDFELYASDDLRHFDSTGLSANSSGRFGNELNLTSSFDKEFYIFRMKFK